MPFRWLAAGLERAGPSIRPGDIGARADNASGWSGRPAIPGPAGLSNSSRGLDFLERIGSDMADFGPISKGNCPSCHQLSARNGVDANVIAVVGFNYTNLAWLDRWTKIRNRLRE